MPVVFTALHGYAALLKRPAARLDAIGRYVRGATRTPQVLLDAQVLEAETGLHVSWDVVEDAFPPDLLADMFEGFAARVRRLAADPAAWTSTKAAIAPKPPEADMAARRAANRTAARLPREPIFAGILRQATADPARAAVVAPDRLVTFGALAAEGRRLAAALQAAGGVRPGDLVAVVMPKGWRQAVSVLAIGLCGAAYVPVEMPQPPARIRELLELAGPRLALLHEAPELGPCPCPAKAFDALLAGGWPDEPVPNAAEVGAEDLAYVVFTSGSTGTPKGVAMRHGAVSNTLHDINARFAIGPADRVLGVSSLSFDLSVWDLFGVLGAGGAAVLPMPEGLRDPSYLAALAGREGVTVWNSTPAYLKLVAGAPGVTLPSSLRLALLSGDWLPLPLARLLRERYPAVRLVSLGGATEAAIWSVFQPVERVEEGWLSVPYGLPLANQRLHVLDEALRHCPAGGAGQIHIGGAGLADGYWRDPERTSASFVRHPETGERLYRTGDWGRYLPGGAIEFLGRRDAQVKIGGHRIELPEVEAALLAVPGVTEAIALPVEDADGNQRLVAAYGHAGEAGEAIVRRSLAARLPPYMVPSSLLPCDRLPLTGNGKVDRRAIAARAAGGFGAAQPCAGAGPHDQAVPAATSLNVPAPPASARRSDAAFALGDLLEESGLLLAETERQAFVAEDRGLRRDLGGLPSVPLPAAWSVPNGAPRRVSTRRFATGPVPLDTLAALLEALRETLLADGARRRYPSAGSSYAVQVYVLVAGPGCSGLDAGLWHYAPDTHRLVRLGECPEPPVSLHIPANRPMGEAAAFTLLLFGDLAAIRPLYGAHASDLLRVEAGGVAQLLAERAADVGLGLCAVGWMDTAPLAAALRLSPDHLFLHALVGGLPRVATASDAVPPIAIAAAPRQAASPRVDGARIVVREAWAAVLGHADFDDDSSFFEVGGNSFLAVALQNRLAAAVAPPPSVTDLFRHPTVAALARHLGAGSAAAPPPAGPAESARTRQATGSRRFRQRARPPPIPSPFVELAASPPA